MNDNEIHAAVLREINRERICEGHRLEIQVDRGQVTLDGCVETAGQRRIAEAAAGRVAGARQVINRITVPDALQRLMGKALGG